MVYGLLMEFPTRRSGPTYCIGLILKNGLTIQLYFESIPIRVQQTFFFVINYIKKCYII